MKLILTVLTFLAFSIDASGAEDKLCTFPMKTKQASCKVRSAGESYSMETSVLKGIAFDKNGLAGGTIERDGCFWVNRKGIVRRTHCFDNGPDYFVEGVARYIGDDEKFGFMDEKLQISIPAQFTFAFPFKNGRASVCNGCIKQNVGEHSSYSGGEWFVIDKRGRRADKPEL
jgi:hypothetical protein